MNKSRPQALYERLGYRVVDQQPGGWDEESADGTVHRYDTTIINLRKQLTSD